MICCSSKKYVTASSKTDPSFLPPQEISYSTNLSSSFFPRALQGPSYISYNARPNNMNYAFNRDHHALSNSEEAGLSRKNSGEKWPSRRPEQGDWHAAFGVWSAGRHASSIFLFFFLHEVVRDSSGPKLWGLCEVVKKCSCSLFQL